MMGTLRDRLRWAGMGLVMGLLIVLLAFTVGCKKSGDKEDDAGKAGGAAPAATVGNNTPPSSAQSPAGAGVRVRK